MDKTVRNLLIGLAILVILTPIGLVATGTAYGEWGTDWLREHLGYVPAGMQGVSNTWNAPMSDYGIGGMNASLGYVLSAIAGVVLAGGILYVGGKLLIKNKE